MRHGVIDPPIFDEAVRRRLAGVIRVNVGGEAQRSGGGGEGGVYDATRERLCELALIRTEEGGSGGSDELVPTGVLIEGPPSGNDETRGGERSEELLSERFVADGTATGK